MSQDPHDESLYDAFDKMLDARFAGKDLDPAELLSQMPDHGEEIEAASRLAQELTLPSVIGPVPVIAGYRILQEIGHGGMGTVYLAEQEKLGRRVAIKVLAPSLALSRHSRHRFLAEAKALARLHDDHIVAVHDIFDQEGVLAYAMEWVEGKSLRQLLQGLRHRDLSPQSISLSDLARALGVEETALQARTPLQFWLQTGIAIARALHKVHGIGIVHRDVKPGNILIRRNGQALLADFGLARTGDSSMSLSTGFVGTPIYAPPEQLRADEQELDWGEGESTQVGEGERTADRAVDQRADIYALAVTLYEVLTGKPPFRGQTTAAVLLRITTGRAERLRAAAPGLPRDLEIVLEKAMDPDPAARYPDAASMADDLERVLLLEPIHARRPGLPRRGMRVLRRHRAGLLAAGIGAALMLALGIAWMRKDALERQRPAQVAQLRHEAYLELLQPEVRQATWLDLVRGEISQAEFEKAQEGRRRALRSYEEALVIRSSPRLLAEHAALGLVLRLPEIVEHKMTVEQVQAQYPSLGKIHPLVLRSLTRSTWLESTNASLRVRSIRLAYPVVRPGAKGIDPALLEQRRVWGLLGFLGGAKEICEDSWRILDQEDWDLPLIDVALSQIYLEDGRPALALQRLQGALTLFPSLQDLQLGLAGIAIDLQDYRKARHVLRGFKATQGGRRIVQILKARTLAILDPRKARPLLESLVLQDPADRRPAYALAQIDLRLGQIQSALDRLLPLVRAHPHVSRYRLSLARAALRLGRARTYLDQVRYVVDSRFGAFRSAGVTRDLLDILQIGGLSDLYARAVAKRHAYGSPDAIGVSDDWWEGREGYRSRRDVEARFLSKMK